MEDEIEKLYSEIVRVEDILINFGKYFRVIFSDFICEYEERVERSRNLLFYNIPVSSPDSIEEDEALINFIVKSILGEEYTGSEVLSVDRCGILTAGKTRPLKVGFSSASVSRKIYINRKKPIDCPSLSEMLITRDLTLMEEEARSLIFQKDAQDMRAFFHLRSTPCSNVYCNCGLSDLTSPKNMGAEEIKGEKEEGILDCHGFTEPEVEKAYSNYAEFQNALNNIEPDSSEFHCLESRDVKYCFNHEESQNMEIGIESDFSEIRPRILKQEPALIISDSPGIAGPRLLKQEPALVISDSPEIAGARILKQEPALIISDSPGIAGERRLKEEPVLLISDSIDIEGNIIGDEMIENKVDLLNNCVISTRSNYTVLESEKLNLITETRSEFDFNVEFIPAGNISSDSHSVQESGRGDLVAERGGEVAYNTKQISSGRFTASLSAHVSGRANSELMETRAVKNRATKPKQKTANKGKPKQQSKSAKPRANREGVKFNLNTKSVNADPKCKRGSREQSNETVHSKSNTVEVNSQLNMEIVGQKPNYTSTRLNITRKEKKYEKKIFSCYHCTYTANGKKLLRMHIIEKHSNLKPFICFLCEYSCPKKANLRKHILARHAKEKSFKCPHCNYSTANQVHLKSHVAAAHFTAPRAKAEGIKHAISSKIVNNEEKRSSFETGSEIMNLQPKRRNGRRTYFCTFCPYNSQYQTTLKRHILAKHKKVKPFKCPHCEYCTVNKTNLKLHIFALHTKERPYKCPHCEYSAVQKIHLKKHVNSIHIANGKPRSNIEGVKLELSSKIVNIKKKCKRMREITIPQPNIKIVERKPSSVFFCLNSPQKEKKTEKKPFACYHCTYTANTKHLVRLHIIAKHIRNRAYFCSSCPYKSQYYSVMKRHILAKHSSVKPFRCPHCDYSAAQRFNLRQHILQHSGEKPYKCPHCEYRTAQSAHLKLHVSAIHLKEKPFACKICNFAATQSGSLKLHIASQHKKVKPFKCDECSYSGLRKIDLKRHFISKHSNERPFPCPHCPFSSAVNSNLKSHIIARHSGKCVSCSFCSYTAVNNSCLQKHIKKNHSE